MQPNGGLVPAELSPWKQRQTKIDGRRIQGVDDLLEFHAEGFVDIQFARERDQFFCEIGVDSPIPNLISIGQRITRDRATDAHVVQLPWSRPQTRLDIAKTFSIRQLSKGHRRELIPAGETLDLIVSSVSLDTAA